MSSFGFRFKKKPVDFSKMKDNLMPKGDEKNPKAGDSKEPTKDDVNIIFNRKMAKEKSKSLPESAPTPESKTPPVSKLPSESKPELKPEQKRFSLFKRKPKAGLPIDPRSVLKPAHHHRSKFVTKPPSVDKPKRKPFSLFKFKPKHPESAKKPEPALKPDISPEPETKRFSLFKRKSEPKAKIKPEPKPDLKLTPKPLIKKETEPVPTLGAKPELKRESQPEPKEETKPEFTPEPKPQPKPEPKPEVKSPSEPAPKEEVKYTSPFRHKPEPKPIPAPKPVIRPTPPPMPASVSGPTKPLAPEPVLKSASDAKLVKPLALATKLKTKKIPAAPESSSGQSSFPKKAVIAVLCIVFIGALLYFLGPKYAPTMMDKMGNINFIKKLNIMKKEPEAIVAPEEQMAEELVTVRTYRVAKGDFIDVLPGMGTIKGDREIELRFSVNGIVDSINFFEGDLVRKGDIVATLNQKDALLKLEFAKSKLKTQEVGEATAKKKLQIHQKLYDEGIIIKPKLEEIRLEFESAKTQVVSAEKEVEFALAELDKTYLYAPVNAVLGTKDVEVGEFVNSNIRIASLYETNNVIAEIGIIEKDINRIALGQKAKINVDTYPGVDFEGKIENVAPIIEGKSRTLTSKIRIKNDNPKGTLLPGMFARTWISVYEKKNTIKLPSSCLYDLDSNGEFDSVYSVGEDNVAKTKPIKIGYISTDYVEILDGIREGDQVVSEAMAELKDGVKVDVIEIQEPVF
ncbi:efflux RND transporter periplasmic adaptor subunit [Candidatus Omnitrophota bacterium]